MRVLHGRDRRIASVHKLDRLSHRGVDPAGSSGGCHDEDLAGPRIGAVEFGDDDGSDRGQRVAGGLAGVDTNRFDGGLLGLVTPRRSEALQLSHGRAGRDELAALRAERVPRGQGTR